MYVMHVMQRLLVKYDVMKSGSVWQMSLALTCDCGMIFNGLNGCARTFRLLLPHLQVILVAPAFQSDCVSQSLTDLYLSGLMMK